MRTKQYGAALLTMACLGFVSSPLYAQMDSRSTPYINLELANQRYEFHYPSAYNTVIVLNPIHLAVGYSFTPKFALQFGGMVGKSQNEFVSSGTTITGVPTGSVTRDEIRKIALPLIGRYTLGRPTDKRFNTDLLLGIVFVRSKSKTDKTDTVNGLTEANYSTLNKGWNALLTGGIGSRYSLNEHLQIIGNISLNRNPEINRKLNVTGNSLGLTSSFGLGVQYRFTAK